MCSVVSYVSSTNGNVHTNVSIYETLKKLGVSSSGIWRISSVVEGIGSGMICIMHAFYVGCISGIFWW